MGRDMLGVYFYCLCNGAFLLSVVLFAFAGYAYRVNAKRPSDDPLKRDFHPLAIFLAPITWPFFLLAFTALLIVKAILYGIFLILFTIALLGFRKPFLLVWLEKIATKVGNKLLEANTFLIKVVFGSWGWNPQSY